MAKLSLNFQHDGLNTDGTEFDAAQFAGVSYDLDGVGVVSVPAQFAADGDYAVEADVALDAGDYTVTVVIKHTDGTESAPSNLAAFTVAPILRVPTVPFGLSASYSR